MSINDVDYNTARIMLITAGSKSAGASHQNTHGKGSDVSHGQSLLSEARDEFRVKDKGLPNLRSDVTQAHYNAIHSAARKMSIDSW